MSSMFHNHPAGKLADEYGAVADELRALKARQSALKAEILGRGTEAVSGARYAVSVVQAVRFSLDTKRVKAELGEDWYDSRCTATPTTSLRVSAIPVPAVAA